MWCWRRQAGEKVAIAEITREFIKVNQAETAQPGRANVEIYREVQALQDEMSAGLRGVFVKHRHFVTR